MITMTNQEIHDEYCDMRADVKAQVKGTIAKIEAEGEPYRLRVLTALKKASAENNRLRFIQFAVALLETKQTDPTRDAEHARARDLRDAGQN